MAKGPDIIRNDSLRDVVDRIGGKRGTDYGREIDENQLHQAAGEHRAKMLKEIGELASKGLFSREDQQDWERKIQGTHDRLEDLKTREEELHVERERAETLQALFDENVYTAEKEGWLYVGEHEKWDEKFVKTRLAERESVVKEVQDTLRGRVEEITKEGNGLRAELKTKLEHAKDFGTKEEIVKKGKEHKENEGKYAKLFGEYVKTGAFSESTWKKYEAWFATLSLREQKEALNKALRDDIKPRVELWEAHEALPKEYKKAEFAKAGSRERKRILGQIERDMDNNYREALEKGKNVFCPESYNFYRQEFFGKESPNPKERLVRKANFLTMIEGQIKAESSLIAEYKKFPKEIQNMFHKKWEHADFAMREKLLKKEVKEAAEKNNKALALLNKVKENFILDIFMEDFDSADNVEDRFKIAEQAHETGKSYGRYMRKFRANAKFFRHDAKIYEDWWKESIHSLDEAVKAEFDLDDLIQERKDVHVRSERLTPRLKKRYDPDAPVSDRQKQLDQLEKIDAYYKSGIMRDLIEKGKQAEEADDLDAAFAEYLKALKLDPEDEDILKITAALKQKGAQAELRPASEDDKKMLEHVMEHVDHAPQIEEDAKRIALDSLFADLIKQNIEYTGASEDSTAKSRQKRTISKVQDKEMRDVAQTIEQEQSGKQHGELVLGDDEVFREKITLKKDGSHQKEDMDKVQTMLSQKGHKSADVQRKGVSEFEVENTAGNQVSYRSFASGIADRRAANDATYRTKIEDQLEAHGIKGKKKEVVMSLFEQMKKDLVNEERRRLDAA